MPADIIQRDYEGRGVNAPRFFYTYLSTAQCGTEGEMHRMAYLTAAASAADHQKGYATMRGVISRAGANCGVRNQPALL